MKVKIFSSHELKSNRYDSFDKEELEEQVNSFFSRNEKIYLEKIESVSDDGDIFLIIFYTED